MKKFLSGWKLRTILSALIFFATFGLVVYAANSTGGLFDKYKTWANWIWNELRASDWDNLMNDLNKLEIPEWAVMAFAWECPTELWWTEYTETKWKFILWANGTSYKLWDSWGEYRNYLTPEQLPSHSHYVTYANTNKSSVDWLEKDKNATIAMVGNEDRDLDGGATEDTFYWLRYVNKTADAWKTSSVWNWAGVSNMPPYVTLKYCIKWKSDVTVTYSCKWTPPANTTPSTTKPTIPNMEWRYNETANWPCQYKCKDWYILENNICKNYSYSVWCCNVNWTNSYSISCRNGEHGMNWTTLMEYCEKNAQAWNIWMQPKDNSVNVYCKPTTSNSYEQSAYHSPYARDNKPLCPWESYYNNSDSGPWIGYPGRDMY